MKLSACKQDSFSEVKKGVAKLVSDLDDEK